MLWNCTACFSILCVVCRESLRHGNNLRSEPDVAGSTWEWQLWVKALWSLSWSLQRTMAGSSYWGYVNLEGFFFPYPNKVKNRGIYIKAAKGILSETKSPLCLNLLLSLPETWGYGSCPCQSAWGCLSSQGKGHQNISTWAKKDILSQKASGEWLCWNSLEQLIRKAGFWHGKLHLRWTRLLQLYTPCGVGTSPARGNVGCLRQIRVGAPVIKGNPSERKSVLECYCSLFPVSQCCS